MLYILREPLFNYVINATSVGAASAAMNGTEPIAAEAAPTSVHEIIRGFISK